MSGAWLFFILLIIFGLGIGFNAVRVLLVELEMTQQGNTQSAISRCIFQGILGFGIAFFAWKMMTMID